MNSLLKLLSISAFTVSLFSCGGGGGGGGGSSGGGANVVSTNTSVASSTNSSAASSSTNQFNPDATLLTKTAEDSGSLYVDKTFSFDEVQKHTLLISVHNSDASVAAFKQVFVYALPEAVTEVTDENLDATNLLLSASTDASGMLYQAVEWPGHIKKVAVKVDVLGIATLAIINLNTDQIAFDFR